MTAAGTAEPASEPAALDPIPRSAWLTLFVVSVAVFTVAAELEIFALTLPEIRQAFPNTSESVFPWVISVYSLGLGALLLVAGWLADRYGRRRVFLRGLALYALGAIVVSAAPGIEALIGAKILQSVGGAMMFPAGLALALTAFPRSRHQLAMGVWGAMGWLAAAVGLTVGALIDEWLGWRAAFFINVPVTLAALVVGYYVLEESTGELAARRVKAASVPLAAVGVGAILLGVGESDAWGWGPVAALTAAGIVLLIVFVTQSLRQPEPLFPMSLFKLRSWTVGNIGTFLFAMAYFSTMELLPGYVERVWGWSVLHTGLVLAAGPIVSFAVSPYGGRLADRIGNAPVVAAGASLGAAGMLWYRIFLDADPVTYQLVIGNLLTGAAAGFCFASLAGAALRDVPTGMYAEAGAGRTTILQIAVAASIELGFTLAGHTEDHQAALAGSQQVWTVSAVCYLVLAVLFALAYPRRTVSQAEAKAVVAAPPPAA